LRERERVYDDGVCATTNDEVDGRCGARMIAVALGVCGLRPLPRRVVGADNKPPYQAGGRRCPMRSPSAGGETRRRWHW